MSDTNSQLSYQTTMPEYPDVSKKAWYFSLYGNNAFAEHAYRTSMIPLSGESYDTWRTNQLDRYNAQLSAYNTWLSSGAGKRASAESGNYNPSYFDTGNASASPINYGQTQEGNPFSDMAQGISGIFQFANAFQALRMMTSQIAGQQLKNEAQAINNKYLSSILQGRVSGLNFQNDKRQFELEQLFYPRWSAHPELWKAGVFSPYGREAYDLRDANLGFGYQRAAVDIDYLKAGKTLRDAQVALANASTKEKQWYQDNMFEIMKDMMENSSKILKGEYDFQKTEQQLRKAGVIANISVGVINAAVNAIKTFIPSISGGLGSLAGGTLPGPLGYPNLGPSNGGLDFGGFGSFSPYE